MHSACQDMNILLCFIVSRKLSMAIEGAGKRRSDDGDTPDTSEPRPTKKIRFEPTIFTPAFPSPPGIPFANGNRVLQFRCRTDEVL